MGLFSSRDGWIVVAVVAVTLLVPPFLDRLLIPPVQIEAEQLEPGHYQSPRPAPASEGRGVSLQPAQAGEGWSALSDPLLSLPHLMLGNDDSRTPAPDALALAESKAWEWGESWGELELLAKPEGVSCSSSGLYGARCTVWFMGMTHGEMIHCPVWEGSTACDRSRASDPVIWRPFGLRMTPEQMDYFNDRRNRA